MFTPFPKGKETFIKDGKHSEVGFNDFKNIKRSVQKGERKYKIKEVKSGEKVRTTRRRSGLNNS